MKILGPADFKLMPWKNGRGVTTEMFRIDHNGKMIFRISSALVSESGPFSDFSGYKRGLVNLGPGNMNLNVNHISEKLEMLAAVCILDGGAKTSCIVDKPCYDFNVFAARGIVDFAIQIFRVSRHKPQCFQSSGCHALFAVDGTVIIDTHEKSGDRTHSFSLAAGHLALNNDPGSDGIHCQKYSMATDSDREISLINMTWELSLAWPS